MVNGRLAKVAVLLLAGLVLTGAAWLRGAEYDEQYTLFLTAGTPRPAWPDRPITAGEVVALQTGSATPAAIARALRRSDVHPPLYFWAAAWWRDLAGDGLFALRLLSVGCGLGALALVGSIAGRVGVPAAAAMLLTLGCYGFAYTAAVARGFALAQVLTLAGIACALGPLPQRPSRRGLLAGGLFGAATLTNYLAVFVAAAMLLGSAIAAMRRRDAASTALAGGMAAGFALALPLDAWFYLAQHGSRAGQFPPFAWLPALGRLATYGAGAIVGGLPLYVGPALRQPVSLAIGALLLALAALVATRWRQIGRPATRHLLLIGLAAPPAGLLALGIVFDNTPIELRYLAFATPFAGLLLAGAIASLPRHTGAWVTATVLGVQALGLAGLLTRAETMQPARAAAQAAAAVVAGGVVLLPFGNDGVGIVGAFAQEAPPDLPLLVVHHDAAPTAILARVAPYRRVTLARLAQDADSRDTLARLSEIFAGPCWRRVAGGSNVAAYERTCEGTQDVLRGVRAGDGPGPGRDDPATPRRVGAAAAAAARQPADTCDVAPGGADPGAALHGDLPGPARLRPVAQAAGDTGPCALRQDGDGTRHDRGDGPFRP